MYRSKSLQWLFNRRVIFHSKLDENLYPLIRKISCSSLCASHYDTLGLERNAKEADIKDAYISLTKKHHPDAKSNSDDSDEFLKIAEAYKVLSNSSTRREYDFKKFGMSSETNRFETGEYEAPRHVKYRRARREIHEKPKQESSSFSNFNITTSFALSPEVRRIFDYAVGIMTSICLAMYFISRYKRKRNELDEEKSS